MLNTPRRIGSLLVALTAGVVGCGKQSEPAPEQAPPPAPPPAKAPAEPAAPPPASDDPPVRKDGTVLASATQMGTRVSINVWVPPGKTPGQAKAALEGAFAEIERIEDIMSEWRPQSELSRFNRTAGGKPVEISPELFHVLERSNAISRASGGAFDVTFHGVGQLWRFSPGSRPPTREAVAEKLKLVDYRKLELDRQASTARLAGPGMKVGLGAIAKGYGVDVATAHLRKAGFGDHIVEAGGDTFVSGTKGGKPWMVGVQAPERQGTAGMLQAKDEAIVTSGDYQRFFEFEGKRYAHILDPRTGWPVEESRAPKSTSCISPNATDADGYCTAVSVMGPEAGLKFAEQQDDLEVVIIKRDGEVLVSSGLRDRFTPTPAPGNRPPTP